MCLTALSQSHPVPDFVSACLSSIVAKHTGGVPEESFGSLPEVGTEPCCFLFPVLHPHFSSERFSKSIQLLSATKLKLLDNLCDLGMQTNTGKQRGFTKGQLKNVNTIRKTPL